MWQQKRRAEDVLRLIAEDYPDGLTNRLHQFVEDTDVRITAMSMEEMARRCWETRASERLHTYYLLRRCVVEFTVEGRYIDRSSTAFRHSSRICPPLIYPLSPVGMSLENCVRF